MARHIFLIGFMGSGKTHLGRAMAEKLDCPFFDLDAWIEAKEGKTVAEIFAERGEVAFRELESKHLRDLANLPPAIVATGGGTPCFFDNMDWMNATGATVYLKTPANVLFARLEKESATRPLLTGLSRPGLQAFIERLLAEREAFYLLAKVVVELESDDPKALEKLLAAYLAFWKTY